MGALHPALDLFAADKLCLPGTAGQRAVEPVPTTRPLLPPGLGPPGRPCAGRRGVRQDGGGLPSAAGGGWGGLPGGHHGGGPGGGRGGRPSTWRPLCSAGRPGPSSRHAHAHTQACVRLYVNTRTYPHTRAAGPHRDPGGAALPRPAGAGAAHEPGGNAAPAGRLPAAARRTGGCRRTLRAGLARGLAHVQRTLQRGAGAAWLDRALALTGPPRRARLHHLFTPNLDPACATTPPGLGGFNAACLPALTSLCSGPPPHHTPWHTCSPPPPLLQLTGSVKGKARTVLNEALARGDIEIAVGTHALISDSTQFARLGLAVVDEQHK